MNIKALTRETLKVVRRLPAFFWLIAFFMALGSLIDSQIGEWPRDWQRILGFALVFGVYLLWSSSWLILAAWKISGKQNFTVKSLNVEAGSRILPSLVFYMIFAAWLALASLPGVALALFPAILLQKLIPNVKILLILAPLWIVPALVYCLTVFSLTLIIVTVLGWDTPNPFTLSYRLVRPRFWLFLKLMLIWGAFTGLFTGLDLILAPHPGAPIFSAADGGWKWGLRIFSAVGSSASWIFFSILSTIAYRRLDS